MSEKPLSVRKWGEAVLADDSSSMMAAAKVLEASMPFCFSPRLGASLFKKRINL